MERAEKSVLITGAAGGIGLAAIEKFLTAGIHVVATDIDTGKISERYGQSENVSIFTCDITDIGSARKLKTFCEDKGYAVSVMLLCAGIYETYPVTEASPEKFRRMMEVNFISQQILISLFLDHLMRSKGRVITISSESYRLPALFQPYMVSKAALEAFAVTARQELMLKGVKMIIIRPGAVKTDLLNWMKKAPDDIRNSVYEKQFNKLFTASVKMVDRPARPARVASLIVKAATSRHPKKIYNINHSAKLLLLGMVPAGIREWFIKKVTNVNTL